MNLLTKTLPSLTAATLSKSAASLGAAALLMATQGLVLVSTVSVGNAHPTLTN